MNRDIIEANGIYVWYRCFLYMELAQLEAFERAAHLGSFTRAAEDLDLTQPSVSARIAGLEAELGGELFERGGRQLKLTPLGEMFLPYAERALAAVRDGRRAASRFREGRGGAITIATFVELALYLLAEPMDQLREQFPTLDIRVRLRTYPEIIAMLQNGDAALGLAFAPLWQRGIKIEAHFQERLYPIAASTHPLARQQAERGTLYLSDIYEHNIFRVPMSPNVNSVLSEIIEQTRQQGRGALVTVPAIMAVRPVIEGQGIAFLPESFVQRHVDEGRLLCLEVADMPDLYSEPIIISLATRKLDAPSRALVELIRARWRHILVK